MARSIQMMYKKGMKRPRIAALAAILTQKAAAPATRATKNLAAELASYRLSLRVSIPLGKGSSQVEVQNFSVRLKKVSLTESSND
jgi:hypothetical protein